MFMFVVHASVIIFCPRGASIYIFFPKGTSIPTTRFCCFLLLFCLFVCFSKGTSFYIYTPCFSWRSLLQRCLGVSRHVLTRLRNSYWHYYYENKNNNNNDNDNDDDEDDDNNNNNNNNGGGGGGGSAENTLKLARLSLTQSEPLPSPQHYRVAHKEWRKLRGVGGCNSIDFGLRGNGVWEMESFITTNLQSQRDWRSVKVFLHQSSHSHAKSRRW